MKFFVIVLSLIMIQACSSTEKKHPMNYLNGENYFHPDSQVNPSIPPLATGFANRERLSNLKGSVILQQGAAQIPLKMQKVTLKKDDKVLSETVTGLDGTYYFKGVYKNGSYELVSTSKTYQGILKFQISKYDHNDLVIVAQPKN